MAHTFSLDSSAPRRAVDLSSDAVQQAARFGFEEGICLPLPRTAMTVV